jgi:hypothetical protein
MILTHLFNSVAEKIPAKGSGEESGRKNRLKLA